MKHNSGVSMIELVIVMIIMIIIASVAIFSGRDTIDKSEAMELYSEISNMKKAVSGAIAQYELEAGGDDWFEKNGFYADETSGEQNDWHNVKKNGTVKDKLNMESIKRNYLVNYETGDVMLEEAEDMLGSKVRSYDAIRKIAESNKI